MTQENNEKVKWDSSDDGDDVLRVKSNLLETNTDLFAVSEKDDSSKPDDDKNDIEMNLRLQNQQK